MLAKPRLYRAERAKEFKIFLQSQFIERIWFKSHVEKKDYFSSIIKKIVYEDLPQVFSLENPQILYRMVQYIAQKPGRIINNLHLAQEFQLSNKTIALYLSYLEEAFLVNKLYNFSKSLISSERRLKKSKVNKGYIVYQGVEKRQIKVDNKTIILLPWIPDLRKQLKFI